MSIFGHFKSCACVCWILVVPDGGGGGGEVQIGCPDFCSELYVCLFGSTLAIYFAANACNLIIQL